VGVLNASIAKENSAIEYLGSLHAHFDRDSIRGKEGRFARLIKGYEALWFRIGGRGNLELLTKYALPLDFREAFIKGSYQLEARRAIRFTNDTVEIRFLSVPKYPGEEKIELNIFADYMNIICGALKAVRERGKEFNIIEMGLPFLLKKSVYRKSPVERQEYESRVIDFVFGKDTIAKSAFVRQFYRRGNDYKVIGSEDYQPEEEEEIERIYTGLGLKNVYQLHHQNSGFLKEEELIIKIINENTYTNALKKMIVALYVNGCRFKEAQLSKIKIDGVENAGLNKTEQREFIEILSYLSAVDIELNRGLKAELCRYLTIAAVKKFILGNPVIEFKAGLDDILKDKEIQKEALEDIDIAAIGGLLTYDGNWERRDRGCYLARYYGKAGAKLLIEHAKGENNPYVRKTLRESLSIILEDKEIQKEALEDIDIAAIGGLLTYDGNWKTRDRGCYLARYYGKAGAELLIEHAKGEDNPYVRKTLRESLSIIIKDVTEQELGTMMRNNIENPLVLIVLGALNKIIAMASSAIIRQRKSSPSTRLPSLRTSSPMTNKLQVARHKDTPLEFPFLTGQASHNDINIGPPTIDYRLSTMDHNAAVYTERVRRSRMSRSASAVRVKDTDCASRQEELYNIPASWDEAVRLPLIKYGAAGREINIYKLWTILTKILQRVVKKDTIQAQLEIRIFGSMLYTAVEGWTNIDYITDIDVGFFCGNADRIFDLWKEYKKGLVCYQDEDIKAIRDITNRDKGAALKYFIDFEYCRKKLSVHMYNLNFWIENDRLSQECQRLKERIDLYNVDKRAILFLRLAGYEDWQDYLGKIKAGRLNKGDFRKLSARLNKVAREIKSDRLVVDQECLRRTLSPPHLILTPPWASSPLGPSPVRESHTRRNEKIINVIRGGLSSLSSIIPPSVIDLDSLLSYLGIGREDIKSLKDSKVRQELHILGGIEEEISVLNEKLPQLIEMVRGLQQFIKNMKKPESLSLTFKSPMINSMAKQLEILKSELKLLPSDDERGAIIKRQAKRKIDDAIAHLKEENFDEARGKIIGAKRILDTRRINLLDMRKSVISRIFREQKAQLAVIKEKAQEKHASGFELLKNKYRLWLEESGELKIEQRLVKYLELGIEHLGRAPPPIEDFAELFPDVKIKEIISLLKKKSPEISDPNIFSRCHAVRELIKENKLKPAQKYLIHLITFTPSYINWNKNVPYALRRQILESIPDKIILEAILSKKQISIAYVGDGSDKDWFLKLSLDELCRDAKGELLYSKDVSKKRLAEWFSREYGKPKSHYLNLFKKTKIYKQHVKKYHAINQAKILHRHILERDPQVYKIESTDREGRKQSSQGYLGSIGKYRYLGSFVINAGASGASSAVLSSIISAGKQIERELENFFGVKLRRRGTMTLIDENKNSQLVPVNLVPSPYSPAYKNCFYRAGNSFVIDIRHKEEIEDLQLDWRGLDKLYTYLVNGDKLHNKTVSYDINDINFQHWTVAMLVLMQSVDMEGMTAADIGTGNAVLTVSFLKRGGEKVYVLDEESSIEPILEEILKQNSLALDLVDTSYLGKDFRDLPKDGINCDIALVNLKYFGKTYLNSIVAFSNPKLMVVSGSYARTAEEMKSLIPGFKLVRAVIYHKCEFFGGVFKKITSSSIKSTPGRAVFSWETAGSTFSVPRWERRYWGENIPAYLAVAGWGQDISSLIFQRGVADWSFPARGVINISGEPAGGASSAVSSQDRKVVSINDDFFRIGKVVLYKNRFGIDFYRIAELIDSFGIVNPLILEIGPEAFPYWGVISILFGGFADFVQPDNKGIFQEDADSTTRSIEMFTDFNKIDIEQFKKRFSIIPLLLEEAGVLKNKKGNYDIITLMNVLNWPLTNAHRLIPEVLSYIKDSGYFVLSGGDKFYQRNFSIFKHEAEKQGIDLITVEEYAYIGEVFVSGHIYQAIRKITASSAVSQGVQDYSVKLPLIQVEKKKRVLSKKELLRAGELLFEKFTKLFDRNAGTFKDGVECPNFYVFGAMQRDNTPPGKVTAMPHNYMRTALPFNEKPALFKGADCLLTRNTGQFSHTETSTSFNTTSTSDFGRGRPSSLRDHRYKLIASFTFFSASSAVSPWEAHPGRAGTYTEYPPSSSSSITTLKCFNIFFPPNNYDFHSGYTLFPLQSSISTVNFAITNLPQQNYTIPILESQERKPLSRPAGDSSSAVTSSVNNTAERAFIPEDSYIRASSAVSAGAENLSWREKKFAMAFLDKLGPDINGLRQVYLQAKQGGEFDIEAIKDAGDNYKNIVADYKGVGEDDEEFRLLVLLADNFGNMFNQLFGSIYPFEYAKKHKLLVQEEKKKLIERLGELLILYRGWRLAAKGAVMIDVDIARKDFLNTIGGLIKERLVLVSRMLWHGAVGPVNISSFLHRIYGDINAIQQFFSSIEDNVRLEKLNSLFDKADTLYKTQKDVIWEVRDKGEFFSIGDIKFYLYVYTSLGARLTQYLRDILALTGEVREVYQTDERFLSKKIYSSSLERLTEEIPMLMEFIEFYFLRFAFSELSKDEDVELVSFIRDIFTRKAKDSHGIHSKIPDVEIQGVDKILLRGIGKYALELALLRYISNGVHLGIKNIYAAITEYNGWVKIVIEDDGQGIREDLLRLEEKFPFSRQIIYSYGITTREAAGGSGMGLCFSWHVINMLGGVSWADNDSRYGGARFTIKLPVEKREVFLEHSRQEFTGMGSSKGNNSCSSAVKGGVFQFPRLEVSKEEFGRRRYVLLVGDRPAVELELSYFDRGGIEEISKLCIQSIQVQKSFSADIKKRRLYTKRIIEKVVKAENSLRKAQGKAIYGQISVQIYMTGIYPIEENLSFWQDLRIPGYGFAGFGGEPELGFSAAYWLRNGLLPKASSSIIPGQEDKLPYDVNGLWKKIVGTRKAFGNYNSAVLWPEFFAEELKHILSRNLAEKIDLLIAWMKSDKFTPLEKAIDFNPVRDKTPPVPDGVKEQSSLTGFARIDNIKRLEYIEDLSRALTAFERLLFYEAVYFSKDADDLGFGIYSRDSLRGEEYYFNEVLFAHGKKVMHEVSPFEVHFGDDLGIRNVPHIAHIHLYTYMRKLLSYLIEASYNRIRIPFRQFFDLYKWYEDDWRSRYIYNTYPGRALRFYMIKVGGFAPGYIPPRGSPARKTQEELIAKLEGGGELLPDEVRKVIGDYGLLRDVDKEYRDYRSSSAVSASKKDIFAVVLDNKAFSKMMVSLPVISITDVPQDLRHTLKESLKSWLSFKRPFAEHINEIREYISLLEKGESRNVYFIVSCIQRVIDIEAWIDFEVEGPGRDISGRKAADLYHIKP